jgi:type IV conjugative transfer system protein TraL
MKTIKIPRYIDATPQIFFWELDEFAILAVSLGVGIFMGGLNTVLGMGFGLFFVNIFKRYKAGGLPGQLNHLAHWKNIFNINASHPKGGVRRMFK